MAAVVEELAGVGRHCLDGHTAALRAGQGGNELGHAPPSRFISGFSMYAGQMADKATNTVASESIIGQPASEDTTRSFNVCNGSKADISEFSVQRLNNAEKSSS